MRHGVQVRRDIRINNKHRKKYEPHFIYKYSLLMRGIKIKSHAKFIFEYETSVYGWVYIFSIYELQWSSKEA